MDRQPSLPNKQGILEQAQLSTTNATALVAPTRKTKALVSKVALCNTSGSAVTYRLFATESGSSFGVTNALYYDKSLAANTTDFLDFGEIPLAIDYDGQLAARCNTADVLTITVFGTFVEGASNV